MYQNMSWERARRRARLVALFGTASFVAMFSAPQVMAQPQAATPPTPEEEILVTGSLIRGAPAIGVPVTTLGAEEFKQSGALTVSDLLKNVPSVEVNPSTAVNQGGGQINRGQNVNIHGLSGTTSFRTLLLFDGTRYPVQGSNTRTIDPSIIPQLAVERVDVLATGASSTYGSDAVAGVVNVILKRRVEGAITQVRYGIANGGNRELQFSQFYGMTWDGGDIAMTYEVYDRTPLRPGTRDGFTVDFRPWGLDDRRPLLSSIPATISSPGNASTTIGTSCTNCFSVPQGSGWDFGSQNPGPTTTWTALQANKGTTNLVDPFAYSDITDAAQRNAFTVTFDQRITDDIEFFATGFYSNRRSQITIPSFVTPAQSNTLRFIVPTTNPYYPTGAPAGIRAHYSFVRELPPYLSAQTTGGRFTGGFNLELPYEWRGHVFGAVSDDGSRDIAFNVVNDNAANAAIGNTVGPFPTQKVTAYSKPANIPYLNVFCDSTVHQCNSPATLDYISAYRVQYNTWILTEYGGTFDGPVFELPGGMVQAAVGGTYIRHSYVTGTDENSGANAASPDHPISGTDPFSFNAWAVFAQVNIPIFGETNAIPGFRRLEVELSGRYDHYSTVGGTRNPKVSVNWEPLEGLVFRGAYGSAFRAPSFGELSRLSGVQIQPANIGAGAVTNTIQTCPTVGGTPVPGSAGALINPTCSAALMFAPGIFTLGGAGAASVMRGGQALTPETSRNLSVGFDYAPAEGLLAGLDLSMTYWRSKTSDFISSVAVRGVADGLMNPDYTFTILLPGDPNFAAAVTDLATNPTTSFDGAFASNILWISDGFLRNTGSFVADGVDFNGSYSWDMAEMGLGAWHTGIAGTVYGEQTTISFPGAAPTDAFSINAGTGTAARFGVPGTSRYRYRAELGWEDMGFLATIFVNYKSHYYTTQNPPPASFLTTFPDYSNVVPPYITWDLSLGYNTGDEPANDYLKNLDFRFVTLNIFDNPPSFAYRTSTGGGTPLAYDTAVSPLGRFFSIVITKTW